MLCVYAITTATTLPSRIRGLEQEPLRLVDAGGFRVVVGRIRRSSEATPINLRRYAAAIEALAGITSSLLPVRFGTCVPDVAGLGAILDRRSASLAAALRLVRGRAQMTVRIAPPETGHARASRARHATERRPRAPSDPGSGTAYLRGRAEAAVRARHIPGFDVLRAGVTRWVRGERLEKRPDGSATVYHLVPRSLVDAYRRTLTRLATDAGLRIVVSGPWAPYAFATWEA